MTKEWPCTCLPAPLDETCDGCRRNAEAEANRRERPRSEQLGLAARVILFVPLFVIAMIVIAAVGVCLGPTGEE